MYLHRGRWRDRQIVPATWIDDGVKPYSTTDIASGYGHLWWTAFPDHPLVTMHLPQGSYFADGNGGQFIFAIPSEDLVVVHLARMGSAADDADKGGVGRLAVGRLLGMILDAAH